jgi:rhomboid protease GluP
MERQANADRKLPVITFVLVAILITVFGLELLFDFDTGGTGVQPRGLFQPSGRLLAALGGSKWQLVMGGGEWFRLFSAPFLHSGPLHLTLNCLVLLWGGMLLERILGRAWFAAIYTVAGIGGVMMSLVVNPPEVVSVGASGAIMGLMAGLFVTSFHFHPGPVRTRLRTGALQVLIPSLVPVATSLTSRVDVAGHIGGALSGGAMALAALSCWPRAETLPRGRWLAAAVGCAGLAALVVTVAKVDGSYRRTQHEIAAAATLIPDSRMPATDELWTARVDVLAAEFPHDPRLRLFRGATKLDRRDAAGAEKELRGALADLDEVKDVLRPRVEAVLRRELRTNLAIALSDAGKDEARAAAEPVCRLDAMDSRSARMRLKSLGLCD